MRLYCFNITPRRHVAGFNLFVCVFYSEFEVMVICAFVVSILSGRRHVAGFNLFVNYEIVIIFEYCLYLSITYI